MSAAEVAEKLRPKLSGFPGIRAFVTLPAAIRVGGRSSKSSYEFTLQGPDTVEVHREAQKLERLIAKLPIDPYLLLLIGTVALAWFLPAPPPEPVAAKLTLRLPAPQGETAPVELAPVKTEAVPKIETPQAELSDTVDLAAPPPVRLVALDISAARRLALT